jgi:AraC-like DNA-binding protein
VPDNLDIESAGRPLISYARTLPFASKAKQYGGYVAVHIKAEAITRIMTEVMPDQADQTWLIDEQGRIIAHSDAGRLYDSMAGEPYVQAILAGETLNKTLIHRLDGQTSVVTWHKLSGLGWVLISQTPVTAFYRQSATIRWVLLLITVAAMLIGLILAGYFTSSIYKPFRQSVSRASALSQTSGTSAGLDAGDNELDVIDRTVRCLSGKINELECSLDANKPLIKHQLLSGLMQGQIPTRHDLAGFEAMLGLDLVFPGYVPMSFNLDDRQFAEWDAQQVQLIKIDLVRRFEDLSGETGLGLAAESAPAGLYALLCGQTDVLPVAAKRVAAALIDYAHDELGLELKAAICRRVSDPLTIGQAFAETALYEQYTFFMPELQILTFERIDEREHSCCHLPDHLTENVARALHRRDQAEVTAKVTTLSTDLAQGLYSLAECQQGLICLNQILARFCQSVRYPDDEVRQNAGFGHGRFKDIRYYQAWYLDFTAELFQQLETRQTGKSAGLVRTIKDYVRANLDRDLSLDLIAGHVNLSARYISRLFKAETSINLTEYINQQRLEYAQHLLVQSDWTVDEISVKSGFHTPSYFIQKFRELYGVTPNHYRISHKMM